MIGRKVLHYNILEKIGEGGMGEVYLAEDTELRRKVALKFLPQQFSSDPDALARFKREAQTAASLNHPNIVTVHEIGEFEGRPYIAMAYVEGQSLGDLIEKEPVSLSQALDICLQICDGLASAHEAGIVHRDMKPHNILLDTSGRVKIVDFGLAKLGGLSKVTQDQSTLGTIYYMSPEQVRSEEVDSRSDIFSVGVVMYELLSGRLPFKGEHAAALVYSITNDEPIPLSQSSRGIPPDLDRVMDKALAKVQDQRYQSISDFAGDLQRIRDGVSPVVAPARRNLVKILLPTSVVFLAVALLLIFKPFTFEIGSDRPAVAAENSVAIMYFKNFVDPDDSKRLGEIVTNLLITDLSESGSMEVVSDQRLYDILKMQGKEGTKVIDKSTATEVAVYAGVKMMLLGSILQEDPYMMTSQLVDVETGNVIASQRITGQPGDDIFAMVDRLSDEIKQDMSLPIIAPDTDISVAGVTTNSADAYRYYLEGVEAINKYYFEEAREALEQAVAFDSTFAMAYLRLASNGVQGEHQQKRAWIDKAVEHLDNASTKEQHYIRSRKALYEGEDEVAIAELEQLLVDFPDEKDACRALGDIYRGNRENVKAIEKYRRAIEIDPLDKTSYNVLSYMYQDEGDIDNYIWAIYQYISIAPDEANPYDTRGDLFAYSGKPDKALKSYEKALERKSDYIASIKKASAMNMFLGNYAEAERYCRMLIENADPGLRSEARSILVLISLYQGKFAQGMQEVAEGLAADDLEETYGGGRALKLINLASIYAELGNVSEVLPEAKAFIDRHLEKNPADSLGCDEFYCYLLAKNKDFEAVRSTVERMEKSTRKGQGRDDYWRTAGWLALEEGAADSAVVYFERALGNDNSFEGRYPLALAYLEAGYYNDAEQLFEKMVRRFSEGRAARPIWAAKAYYHLGVAYQEGGRPEKAAEQFEVFLDIWKNADENIGALKDARQRLAALKVAG